MKIKRFILICILLFFLIGSVAAHDNSQDNLTDLPDKISDYTYYVEIPEGNVTNVDSGLELRDLPGDAYGNVSFSIDGVKHYDRYMNPDGNRFDMSRLNLPFGLHTAEIKYSGDEKYSGIVKSSVFNLTPIIIEVPDEVEKDNYYSNSIEIFIAEGVKGNLKVTVDGKEYLNTFINENYYDENSYISVNLADLNFGTHPYEVTYSKGNQKAFTKKGSFNVSYLFDVDYAKSIKWGEIVEFEISLPENAHSNVTATINNKTYNIPLDDSFRGIFKYDNFTLGKNNITFTYKDDNLPEKSVTKTVEVTAKLTAARNIEYKNNESIILEVAKGTYENLSVKINSTEYVIPVEEGVGLFSLDNLTPGRYAVNITYPGNEVSYELEVLPNFHMPKKIWQKETYNLTFIGPEDYNGVLKLKGALNRNFSLENGKATVPISGLAAGAYRIYAEYDSIYQWELDFTVISDSPDWDMEIEFPDEINRHDSFYTNPIKNMPKEATGNVTIYIDEEVYVPKQSIREITGGLIFYFEDLDKNHTITVSYEDDDYFKDIAKSKSFNLSDVTIEIEDEIYLGSANIRITTPNDDRGTITVKSNNVTVKTQKITPNEYYDPQEFIFSLDEVKTQTVEVTYSGKYGNITKTKTVTPTYHITIEPDEEYYEYGERYSIPIGIPNILTKKITASIDGVVRELIDPTEEYFDGYYLDLPLLKPGIHNITLTYPGDGKYPKKTFNQTIHVVGIIESPGWMYYKDSEYIKLTLPKDAEGTLYMDIDGERYASSKISKGTAKIKLPCDKIGSYNLTAYFSGNYDVKTLEDTIFVRLKAENPFEIKYGDKEYATFNTPYTENGYLYLYTSNGQEIEVMFRGSQVKIPLSKILIGDYSYGEYCDGYIHAEFYDNGRYVDFAEVNIIVNPATKLAGGKNINTYYTDAMTYCLKVYGPYGKPVGKGKTVTIKVGTAIYKPKTDKNSVVRIKLTNAPGKYTIKATYLGVTVKNTLKVKQILALKTVKVKKSAKKLVLTATLKKGKKPIKGKTITFKFKGKTYKAKTNKYGIAKVTIKKSVLKKLKKGKKVTYQATYLKTTVKKTAKIAK